MLFIGIVGDSSGLLAHLFHDGLLGRLSSDTAKFSRRFFKLDLISQLIGWTDSQGIFEADFQTAVKDLVHDFANSIDTEISWLFVELNGYAVCLTIATTIGWAEWLGHRVNDIFFLDSFVFFQNAEGL